LLEHRWQQHSHQWLLQRQIIRKEQVIKYKKKQKNCAQSSLRDRQAMWPHERWQTPLQLQEIRVPGHGLQQQPDLQSQWS
jgi:hypothetical protein